MILVKRVSRSNHTYNKNKHLRLFTRFFYIFNSSNDHRQVIKRSKEVIFLELFKAVHDFETWTEPQQLFSYMGWDTFGKKLKTSQRGSCMINGILLPNLFWHTMRKKCDRDLFLKFEAEGWEFAKCLISLEQFIQAEIGQNNFW